MTIREAQGQPQFTASLALNASSWEQARGTLGAGVAIKGLSQEHKGKSLPHHDTCEGCGHSHHESEAQQKDNACLMQRIKIGPIQSP